MMGYPSFIKSILENKISRAWLVTLMIAVGLAVRLYAALSVPLLNDEKEKIAFTREISFAAGHVHLPLGSVVTENPPLLPYLMKLCHVVFGDHAFSSRLPNVILGTLTLLVVYLLVKDNINRATAFLTLTLMTFSQYFISTSRHIEENGIILFFAACTLWCIQKAIKKQRRGMLWLGALMFGLALLTKGTVMPWLPVLVFYVFYDRQNARAFSKKDLIGFVLLIGLMIAPSIVWNMGHGLTNYAAYGRKIDFPGLSLGPTALFLGEIMIKGLYKLDGPMISYITSEEFPFVSWMMGLVCIAAVICFLKQEKNRFESLLVWLFVFNFVLFTFVRPDTLGAFPPWEYPNKPDIYFHLDNFWWTSVSVLPAFILAADMLMRLCDRHKIVRVLIVPAIVIYSVIHTFAFITFPANSFVPRDSVRVRALQNTAKEYTISGNHKRANQVRAYIARHYPDRNIRP